MALPWFWFTCDQIGSLLTDFIHVAVHNLKACNNSGLMTGSTINCLQNTLVNQDNAFVVLQHVQCPFPDGFLQHVIMACPLSYACFATLPYGSTSLPCLLNRFHFGL